MLLAVFGVVLFTQAGPPPQQRPATAVRDSTPRDSVRPRGPIRLPVTAAVLASAFHDATARELFNRARTARLAQDSSLTSYDAKVRQRFSVQVGIGKLGRDRLVYRQESASRVQWQQGVGARVDVTGARVTVPVIGSPALEREAVEGDAIGNDMSPIPYFPGSETLWIGGDVADAEVNERSLVNPIAGGAEAYYTYESGDSVTLRLPDGRAIQLRELKVRPRVPKANVAVGSLWFHNETGQLARAVYRLAVPATLSVSVGPADSSTAASRRMSTLMRGLISPMSAHISAIVVEYGLYEGRFWLPRIQTAEGLAQATFVRVPIKFENAFSYNSVNAALGLAAFTVDTTITESPRRERPPAGLDTAARRKWRDSTRVIYEAQMKARRDSVKAGLRVGSMRQCDTSETRVVTRYRYGVRLPVQVSVPCDIEKLTHSPDLPESAFDTGDEAFRSPVSDRLINAALAMDAQAPFSLGSLPRPRYQIGPSMTRYNRVEGLSTGLLVEQQLGGGYSAMGSVRFGFADREPNAELSIARTNLSKTIRVNGYNRLVSANDWGDPLTFRSSLSTFLFGRDEGFYYRASGAELLWTSERGVRLDWRAFTERQRTAAQHTDFSLGASFGPNIIAADGWSSGAGVRFLRNFGDNPRGFRMFTDLRLEGAGGDSTYGRGALDLVISRPIVGRIDGALTLSGGTSVGHVPTQRRWFLGGTQTVRGQSADTAQSGNAFWLARAELARGIRGFRPVLFADLGWTGDRTKLSDVGRPLSGVGVGLSALDGLIRFDVARGLYPKQQTRIAFYLEGKF